jgi:hypothetical protein
MEDTSLVAEDLKRTSGALDASELSIIGLTPAAGSAECCGVSNGITKAAHFGHQKYLVRTTCSTVVGKCLKIRTAARLYEAQSHGVAAYHAWHLNGGSKARAGWRWAGDLHCILIF